MKTKKASLVFLIGIITIMTLELTIADALGVGNGPNYWGMGYPGTINSKTRYKHPELPSDYVIATRKDSESKGYDGSHYGTHDWIADATVRSLIDPLKNPMFYLDWRWLITPDIARNKWPAWKKDYGISGKHQVIRSYFSFLYATQMPDTKITPTINIPQEGVTIKDFGYGKMWIGQKSKHVFQFEVIGDGSYGFAPVNTPILKKIEIVSEQAVECIGKNRKNEEGKIESTLQPEGAALWLGAMTHYIADMIVPAHLLQETGNSHVYSSSYYHNWFENNLASITKWDKKYKANGGPDQGNFSWDYRKVTAAPIIPIKPKIATTLMAVTTINMAYRTDGRHQYVPIINNNHNESKNSGLYINEASYNTSIYWDWKADLYTAGRTNSIHRYFYDKVEHLLCWAAYFTACAMQYCYNEGRKKSNAEIINSDYYVRNPAPPGPKKEIPDGDAQTSLDKFKNSIPIEKTSRNLNNLAKLLHSVALVGVSFVLREISKNLR